MVRPFWMASVSTLALAGILQACAPPPPTTPTVQAAATAVVVTVQARVTAVVPTVSAAQTQVAPTISAAQTLVAPTVSAAQTQVAPTVVAAHTEVAPTVAAVQATATAVAPTAQAVATRVAPTVEAVATLTSAAFGTQVAQSPVHVTAVRLDSADTQVVVTNVSPSTANLDNYTLVMGPVFAVILSNIDVPAGQSVTLHMAVGETTPTDVYLGFGSNAASNNMTPGMRVVLVEPREQQIASVYTLS